MKSVQLIKPLQKELNLKKFNVEWGLKHEFCDLLLLCSTNNIELSNQLGAGHLMCRLFHTLISFDQFCEDKQSRF